MKTKAYYLTQPMSSQVIQDQSRAKSGNCLAEFVCVMLSSFSVFVS